MSDRRRNRRPYNFKDLMGQRFGKLLVIRYAWVSKTTKKASWLCRCDCGNEATVCGVHLTHELTTSCGCHRKNVLDQTTHGKTHSRTYRIWCHIRRRCYEESSPSYAAYGAAGVIVCDRWRDSFENFLADMGECTSSKHSLDRFPNQTGNYEPGNCRWATTAEQNRNKSNNVMLTYNGKTLCMEDWSRITGLKPATIHFRLKAGWSHERIITTPVARHGTHRHEPFTFCG